MQASEILSSTQTGYTFQGAHSQPWAPPEQIAGAQALPSADIYALGRVMMFLLTGNTGTPDYSDLDDQWKAIIEPCLGYDPDARPTIEIVGSQLLALKF
jgi:serine/threonine protein kinase